MKICPNCNQTYNDATLNFCLNDGSLLIEYAGKQEQPTVFMPKPNPTMGNVQATQQTVQSSWNQNNVIQPKKKSRAWLWVLGIFGVLFVFGIVGGIGLLAYIGANLENNPTKIRKTDEKSSSSDGALTLDNYNKIKNGMTYDEVIDIMGSEGTENMTAGSGAYEVKSYQWKGDNFKFISIVFMGGKVTSKVQSNLE
jgi:hypothetical protein